MGAFYDEVPENLLIWVQEQKIFWVATAPLDTDGHVNVSPKGTVGTLHIESPTLAWYEDLSGSGAETFAHIQENGRITLLFTAFEGPPRIVRLFGKGTAHLRGSDEYRRRIPAGDERPGSRAVISVAIEKVGSSCGYSIPYFAYVKERDTLDRWAARKEGHTNLSEPTFADDEDLRAYWIKRTSTSIDGLPGIGQQWDPSVPAPTPAATKACATAPKPTPSWASRLPLVASHVAAAAAGAGLVHAHHEGLVDLKLVAGLATATVAWVVGQAVGAPVPAPCCAMGL